MQIARSFGPSDRCREILDLRNMAGIEQRHQSRMAISFDIPAIQHKAAVPGGDLLGLGCGLIAEKGVMPAGQRKRVSRVVSADPPSEEIEGCPGQVVPKRV
jgi:hypothetical protein